LINTPTRGQPTSAAAVQMRTSKSAMPAKKRVVRLNRARGLLGACGEDMELLRWDDGPASVRCHWAVVQFRQATTGDGRSGGDRPAHGSSLWAIEGGLVHRHADIGPAASGSYSAWVAPEDAPRRAMAHDARMTSRLSLWSEDSVLSVASRGSMLSIGSVGSFASIGSIGSFGSLFSIGSALSAGSALSWLSRWSVMSDRSVRGVLSSRRR
jgi:hypothetical protein